MCRALLGAEGPHKVIDCEWLRAGRSNTLVSGLKKRSESELSHLQTVLKGGGFQISFSFSNVS